MRIILLLMATTCLSACGGDPQSAGSNAVAGGASGSGSTGASVGGTGTTGTGTTGAGTGTGSGTTGTTTSTPAADYAQFATPTVAKTYTGVGSSQGLKYSSGNDLGLGGRQQQVVYAGNASTLKNTNITLSYDPRDATFTLKIADPLSLTSVNTRFQDPANRTDFTGTLTPQWGVPDLGDASVFKGDANTNVGFLQAGDGNPISPYRWSGTGTISLGSNSVEPDGTSGSTYQSTTFFYQKPGSGSATSTTYVSFAGFVRNDLSFQDGPDSTDPLKKAHTVQATLTRGAFAYGVLTDLANVPKTGSASYTGGMLATMVNNSSLDGKYGPIAPTYFQWISGTSTTTVDFAKNSFGLALAGTVGNAYFENYTGPGLVTIAPGTSFTAAGSGTINLSGTGGFTGTFQTASFGATTNGAPTALSVAGSSIDGAFYGPKGEEVGGGFRIVGGTPDQRIDVLGAFTGKGK